MARVPDLETVAEAELDDITGVVTFTTGEALEGSKYQVGRDNSGTNALIVNAPSGAPIQLAIDGSVVFEVDLHGLTSSKSMVWNTTTVNAATYTVTSTDHYIGVTYTATGTVAVSLPAVAGIDDGFVFELKDEDYNASVNNITVTPDGSEKINNAANFVLDGDGESITVLMSNGAWHVI